MMRGQSHFWLTSALVLAALAAFQNCGGSRTEAVVSPNPGKEISQRVISDAGKLNRIVFDPLLEISAVSKTYSMPHLEIDLNEGTLRITHNSATASCPLDTDRLGALHSILSAARICEPGPLAHGQVSCMAISMADIELADNTRSIYLRPVVCMNGTFLCDGLDQGFRELLADLRDNPPAGCTLQ